MNPHHPGHPGHQGHPGHPSHPAAYPHHQSLSSSPHHPGPGNPHHGYTPGGGGGGNPAGGGPTTTPDLPSPHSPSHGAQSDPGVPYTTLTGSQGMNSNGHHHGAGGGMIGEHPHHPGHPHPHHPGHPAYSTVNHNNNNNNCTLKQEGGPGGPTSVQQCAGCGGRIVERWLLHALDRYWHNGCLKCSCCGAALADIGESCFTKGGMILCKTDYTRLFGSSGACAGCAQTIPASEFVMRAGGSVFHLKCFTCSKCGTQLVSGDRYCLLAGAPVCETDWHKMVKSSGVGASGNGGAPVRKGKVGRPRRSRD